MIKTLIIGLVAVMYGIELFITLVNYARRKQPIPANARHIYDKERYTQWLNYSLETLRLGVIGSSITTTITLILLGSGAFGWLERLTGQWFNHPILETLGFLGVLMLAGLLLSLPFDYYTTFVIEEKYGFNKTSHKTFWLDFIKNLLLTAILGGGIIALLQALFLVFIARLWIFILSAWGLLSVLLVIFFLLSTKVFVKLFNRLTPLPGGEFKDKIQDLADRVGFNVNAIWVMDASRRSTKLNAFFSGLGKSRDVVLYDTLVEKLGENEILTVQAHELGHAKRKDTLRMLVQQIAVFGLYAGMIGAVLQNAGLGQSFGLTGAHFGFNLLLFGILVEPIQLLLGILLNYLSRKAEFAADAVAARMVGKEATANALTILAQENLENLNPHPWYVWMHYSHPPIPERLQAIHKA